MSSISRAHSPTVSGAPSVPRSAPANGPSLLILARSDLNPSDGFLTSIIASPRVWSAVQHHRAAHGLGRSPRDEEPRGHRPGRSGDGHGKRAAAGTGLANGHPFG